MTKLYDALRAENKCPVCGQDKSRGDDVETGMQMVRYACGASFGVSYITGKIEAFENCPSPSLVAAEHMMERLGKVGV